MVYDDIDNKDEKTLSILYRVIKSDEGRLSFAERLYCKLYCKIDITSKEEICIYDYLSDEGYIKPKKDLRKDGMIVYYQSKDLDNYLTDDGRILIRRLRKRLFTNVFLFLFKIVKNVCTG